MLNCSLFGSNHTLCPGLLAQYRVSEGAAVGQAVCLSGLEAANPVPRVSLCCAVLRLQELVAHEAVVAETSRAQQKAKEAAAAVDAVSSAAQQLGAVDTATNQTLGSLAAAAAALNTIAAPKEGTGSGKGHGGEDKQQAPSVWDLKGRIEQHKQKVGLEALQYGCSIGNSYVPRLACGCTQQLFSARVGGGV